MKSVTVYEIIVWGPCDPPYSPEYVRELAGGKTDWTALEILDLDIPPADRLWVVLRPELIEEHVLHTFGCDCAEWALENERQHGREPHPDSWKAVEVKRAWIRSEASDEELAAARSDARSVAWATAGTAAWTAARAAAWDAAGAAAWDAAWDAAWTAAGAAAGAAAWDAARAAAWDAAWTAARAAAGAAARAAAREWQVNHLRSLITPLADGLESG